MRKDLLADNKDYEQRCLYKYSIYSSFSYEIHDYEKIEQTLDN